MLCYYFACKLEDEMREAGIELPKHESILDYFPPYRLMRNIEAINQYVGLDVSEHVLREHVYNIFKKDILIGLDTIHELLDTLNVEENSWARSVLYALDVKVYNFRNRFRTGIKGHRRETKQKRLTEKVA